MYRPWAVLDLPLSNDEILEGVSSPDGSSIVHILARPLPSQIRRPSDDKNSTWRVQNTCRNHYCIKINAKVQTYWSRGPNALHGGINKMFSLETVKWYMEKSNFWMTVPLRTHSMDTSSSCASKLLLLCIESRFCVDIALPKKSHFESVTWKVHSSGAYFLWQSFPDVSVLC